MSRLRLHPYSRSLRQPLLHQRLAFASKTDTRGKRADKGTPAWMLMPNNLPHVRLAASSTLILYLSDRWSEYQVD